MHFHPCQQWCTLIWCIHSFWRMSVNMYLLCTTPLIGGSIKQCFCLTSVCLSVAYIRAKSRTETPRKTKIGTEVAHVTRDSDTTFKVKRSNVKVTRPLCSPPCWRVGQLQRWAWERVGREKLLLCLHLLGRARHFGAHGGRRGAGAYRGGRPPTACWRKKEQVEEANRSENEESFVHVHFI